MLKINGTTITLTQCKIYDADNNLLCDLVPCLNTADLYATEIGEYAWYYSVTSSVEGSKSC